MPWNLDISTIDVGQGESALVTATDGLQTRVMLIDGGKQGQAGTVNTYVAGRLGATPVDHILVTHYDVDHSGGIMSLLEADNFFVICNTLAAAGAAQAIGANPGQIAVSVGAAICATILGCYNDFQGQNYSAQAATIATNARNAWNGLGTVQNAARFGVMYAEQYVNYPLNSFLVPTTIKRRDSAYLGALAAVNALANALNVPQAVFTDVFNCLRTVVSSKPQFVTDGRFNRSQMIDTGNPAQIPGTYTDFVAGGVYMSDTLVQAPGVNRPRLQAAYGSEVLWNSGPNAMPAPAGAPAVYVMARNGRVWDGTPNGSDPIGGIAIDNNKDSYGLILRFNNFFFYTGGDLTSAGEDMVADAVMGTGLPNPAGGAYPIPNRIAAFKCGHHGADTCTSAYFLTTINPRAAMISTGQNSYGHPDQGLVNRLNGRNPFYFYLTGCYYQRTHIPASYNPAGNQLLGANRSRVAGGLAIPPGNIELSITQANSTAPAPNFQVTYYEYDMPQAFRTEINPF